MQIGVDLIAKLSRSLCAFVPLCLFIPPSLADRGENFGVTDRT